MDPDIVEVSSTAINTVEVSSSDCYSVDVSTALPVCSNSTIDTSLFYLNSNPSGFITAAQGGGVLTINGLSGLLNITGLGGVYTTINGQTIQISGVNTNIFLTGFNSGQYLTGFNSGQYLTGFNSGQYLTGFNSGQYALNSQVVFITGDQNISGVKTFLTGIKVSGNGIDFHNQTNPAWLEGRVFYDNTEHTLAYYNDDSQIAVNVGQETIVRVVNINGATITNGQVVYIDSSNSNRPAVKLAIASNTTADKVLGVATHDIADNNHGYVTVRGIVRNINTSSFAEGDALYLSATGSGQFVNYQPEPPHHIVKIGLVLNSHSTQGLVFVNPMHINYDLHHLHDTFINTGALRHGDVLTYHSGSGLWIPQTSFSGVLQTQIANITGLTGSFYPYNNPSNFANSGSLQNSGQILYNYIVNTSGNLDNRLYQTGQTLINLINASAGGVSTINGASGILNITGTGNIAIISGGVGLIYVSGNNHDGINLSGNLTTTGQILYNYIINTSGNLDTQIYQTGSNLYNLINNFSGVFNNSGANYQSQINTLNINLQSTGQTLDNKINSLSGWTDNISRVSAINVTGFGNQTGVINISGLGTITVFTGNNNFVYISGNNHDGINASGSLTTTGQSLYNYILGLSGIVGADQINLYTSGSDLYNLIDNFSGVFNNSGNQYQQQINTLTNNLITTGQTLDNKINILSGQVNTSLYNTGANLYAYLNTFSGNNQSFSTGVTTGFYNYRVNFPLGPFSITPRVFTSVEISGTILYVVNITGRDTAGFHAIFSNTVAESGVVLHVLATINN